MVFFNMNMMTVLLPFTHHMNTIQILENILILIIISPNLTNNKSFNKLYISYVKILALNLTIKTV